MTKTILTFYLVMFGIYVLFSRQPDWFDSELYPATIHAVTDARNTNKVYKAVYTYNSMEFSVEAAYPLRVLAEGDKVEVIFEYNNPRKASFYAWWGYWIKWEELIVSAILCIVLFQIAVAVNINPDEAAKQRDLARAPEIKRKYD